MQYQRRTFDMSTERNYKRIQIIHPTILGHLNIPFNLCQQINTEADLNCHSHWEKINQTQNKEEPQKLN